MQKLIEFKNQNVKLIEFKPLIFRLYKINQYNSRIFKSEKKKLSELNKYYQFKPIYE